jgi:phosphonopyruvate decarboxylase
MNDRMNVEHFVKAIIESGFSPFTGIPCSVFSELIRYLDRKKDIENHICTCEGEAMGLAGGFALTGRIPLVYMQNDGFCNAMNPITSFFLLYNVPALLIISWRGEPGEKDAPQHKVMGEKLLPVLDVMGISYDVLEPSVDYLEDALKKAQRCFVEESKPFVFIVRKGYFETDETKSDATVHVDFLKKRIEYIGFLSKKVTDGDVILGSTGYLGRELCQIIKRDGVFYMMGSMGCLPAIGLGIAKERPEKRVFVLDGDGSLLMKMGTLATIGFHRPENLIHICLDNNQYESTGGQPTISKSVRLSSIAKHAGYKTTFKVKQLSEFERIVDEIHTHDKPLFIHILVRPGTLKNLQRPVETPKDMRIKLMKLLSSHVEI